MTDDLLLARTTIAAAEAMHTHPPRWSHRNKKALFELVCPPGCSHAGTITVSRWGQRPLPLDERWAAAPLDVEARADVFSYAPWAGPRPGLAWHLNFAHESLFIAYGGPLLAQDELQVCEHPALAAVREWLRKQADPRLQPLTVEHGVATPVLLRGVERRCALATDGLYGNAFARASVEAVLRAARVLRPPTISNILAMEAPSGGVGRYQAAEIFAALATAYTGFAAARAETIAATGADDAVAEIHTGHWGTGAYGGDRVLMAMLQLIAARAARIERVVFHTVDAAGLEPVAAAQARLRALEGATLAEAIAAIDGLGLCWGVANGT